jgi:RecA/RadA recombinase
MADNMNSADRAAKDKALQQALDQIQKQYGKGAIMKLGESGPVTNIEVISTGSVSLDFATGVGGYPKGRIIAIYGPESSGKTTLTLHAIAECQKKGGQAAFIDAEHALDPVYAKNLGVNVDELLVSQPDYGEQALEIAEMLVRSGAIDVIVVDSVAALVPKHEIDGAMGEATVGMQARLMSQALRKLAGIINKTNTKKSMVVLVSVCTVSAIGTLISPNIGLFIAFSVLVYAGYSVSIPVLQDMVAKMADPAQKNLVMGFFNATKSLGSIAGSLTAGFIYSVNAKLPFACTAVIYGVGILAAMGYMVYGKKKQA